MADPEVIIQMRQFKAALLARETAQVNQLVSAWRVIERALEGQILALAQDLGAQNDAGGVISRDKVFRLGRYEALMAQLQAQLAAFTDEAVSTIESGQLQLGMLGIEQAGIAIEGAAGVQVSFAALPVEAVQMMVGNAGDGSPLRTLLEDSWPDGADRLTNALIRGTALGYNPRRVAREMADGVAYTLNRMLNIARTEQLRVYREATRQQYQESGLVEGFRRLATHDSRVCAACLMAEGEIYELHQTLREHPQGRCAIIPIIIGVDQLQWERGPDWFVKQPPRVQQDILGKGRFEAWQDGLFDLDQLVDVRKNRTWGDSLQPTSLKALREGHTPINLHLNALIGRDGSILPSEKRYTARYHQYQSEWDVNKSFADDFLVDDPVEYKKFIDEARDQIRYEERVSRIAERFGYIPGEMNEGDWRKLADDLEIRTGELLKYSTVDRREGIGNKARGGFSHVAQVGGKDTMVRSGFVSAKDAKRMVSDLNSDTRDQATDYMHRKLNDLGFKKTDLRGVSYDQARRLLAEVGYGESYLGKIGVVSKAERRRVIEGVSEKQQLESLSIAKTPRTAEGLELWEIYAESYKRAGLGDDPPYVPDELWGDEKESLPKYLQR